MRANGWASSAGASLPGYRQDIKLFFRHQNKSTKGESVIESVSINGPYLVG